MVRSLIDVRDTSLKLLIRVESLPASFLLAAVRIGLAVSAFVHLSTSPFISVLPYFSLVGDRSPSAFLVLVLRFEGG